MSKSLIRPAIDLTRYHFARSIHGISCIGTWLTDEKTGRTQPCLVLLHHLRPIKAGRTVPIIIAMDQLWRYAKSDDRTIGDPEHVCIQINDWLANGLLPGSVYNPKDHFRVLDAINECIRDIYHMPPKPHEGSYAIGDVTIRNKETGEIIAQDEVKNDV